MRIVIPARIGSTRFPKKVLFPILGKPLIRWVVEGCLESDLPVSVATDSPEIAGSVSGLPVQVCMTSAEHKSGTDRIWEAALPGVLSGEIKDEEWIVNIQGDEPLVSKVWLDEIKSCIQRHSHLEMVTLCRDLAGASALMDLNTVKVIANKDFEAIYFSRLPIPYTRQAYKPNELCLSYKHIGVYAYRVRFLREFIAFEEGKLEHMEGLEQLRALEMGVRIGLHKVDFETQGVDSPEDIQKVEMKLMEIRR